MLMIRSAMPFTSVSLRKQPRNHSEQDWNTPTLQSPPPVIENQPLHMEGPHREINEEIGSWESCFFLLIPEGDLFLFIPLLLDITTRI